MHMATPKYSPVFAVSLSLMLLLLIAGLVVTLGERMPRLTMMRVFGLLLGLWLIGQLVMKGSVHVWAWEVKGAVAIWFGFFGVLLGGLSAYALVTSLLR